MDSQKNRLDVRRLKAGDARSYRGVLIEALILHPDSFLEDYRAEISRPLSEIEKELEYSGSFGAWSGAILVGIGSAVPCSGPKRRQCGTIRNLYVKGKFRRRGIGGLLLHEILLYAAADVKQLETQILSRHESVVRLFEQFGFRLCGLLPSALRIGQEEIDVWTMTRQLR
jgi:GNAT superfamily N-acetyltransferase